MLYKIKLKVEKCFEQKLSSYNYLGKKERKKKMLHLEFRKKRERKKELKSIYYAIVICN